MEKFQKIMQWGYLIIALILIIESVLKFMDGETNKGILGLIFAGLAIFMYFFKRKFRKRTKFNNK